MTSDVLLKCPRATHWIRISSEGKSSTPNGKNSSRIEMKSKSENTELSPCCTLCTVLIYAWILKEVAFFLVHRRRARIDSRSPLRTRCGFSRCVKNKISPNGIGVHSFCSVKLILDPLLSLNQPQNITDMECPHNTSGKTVSLGSIFTWQRASTWAAAGVWSELLVAWFTYYNNKFADDVFI